MHRLVTRSVLMSVLLIVVVAASACAGLPPLIGTPSSGAGLPTTSGTETRGATEVPGSTETPAPAGSQTPPVVGNVGPVDLAKQALAQQLGIKIEDIEVVSSGQVDWPNGCLGVQKPGIMCTDAIVPGYQVILDANGKQYEMRTDLSGGQVVLAPEVIGETPTPVAAQRARERAAVDLGLELGLVRIVIAEHVEWPDPCLSVPDPLELCAQVITPGYRVVVEANGQQVVYHTDESGQNIRRERQPGSETPTAGGAGQGEEAVIGLRRDVDGTCMDVRIDLKGVMFGACGSEMAAGQFLTDSNRLEQLQDIRRLFQSFGVSTAAGKVTFVGQGQLAATPSEERMVAEWANLVAEETKSGPGAAQYGMSWHREGGIAGFCDDLIIDAGGHATFSSCKSGAATATSWQRLTHDELDQFYSWLDQFGQVQGEQKDPATADAMTVSVTFSGRGTGQLNETEKAGMLQFGNTVLQQWAEATPVRFVTTQAEVNVRKGPSDQFDVVLKIAAGQQALVTGVSRDSTWWRVVCPDNTAGSCWVSADPTLTLPIAPAGSTGLQPGAQGQPAIDETQILAAVVRQVYTVDDTFGGGSKLPQIYLLSVDDTETGAIPYSSPARPLPAPVQQGVIAALTDLPAQFKWVGSAGEVKRNADNAVEGNGAIITVGKVRPQADGTVQVTCSIYLGPRAAGGQTYVLQNQGGQWKVTGTTGSIWIS